MRKFLFSLVVLSLMLFVPAQAVSAYDNITIVIDPGHGGDGGDDDTTLGAQYPDGLLEKNIDLITARAMYEELSQYPNLTVYMTREDDRVISLKDRIDYAQSVGADLVVSVHYNASATHVFYGSEIFTSAFGSCYTTGYGAASCIMNRWIGYGLCDKGIKTRLNSENQDYYGVIRHGKELNIPVIILEHGYLDNHYDFEKIGNEDEWRRLGRIDAEGIADYYAIAKNVMAGTVTPSVSVKLPDDIVYPDDTAPTNIAVEVGEGRVDPGNEAQYLFDYTITCDENESRLMYYNAAIGNLDTVIPEDFADLKLWGDRDLVSDTLALPEHFSGNVVFRVYNIYGLYTDYETHLEVRCEEESEEEEEASEEEEEAETVSGASIEKKDSGDMSDKKDTSSGIIVENEGSAVKSAPKTISSVIESASSDNAMIYGLIFVLATIVFILLIIIIALVKQGVKESKDDDWF